MKTITSIKELKDFHKKQKSRFLEKKKAMLENFDNNISILDIFSAEDNEAITLLYKNNVYVFIRLNGDEEGYITHIPTNKVDADILHKMERCQIIPIDVISSEIKNMIIQNIIFSEMSFYQDNSLLFVSEMTEDTKTNLYK